MNPLLDYFWPLFALGLAVGAILGFVALSRRRLWLLASGAFLVLAGTALWHWPLGAADRFVARVEPTARAVLVDWEMAQVQAQLHHGPLTRRLMLSGPADDFQRSELVRIMGEVPGVSTATWTDNGGLPLLAEAAAASMAGFLLGLLVAYLVVLRRRYNAQWRW